LSLVSWRERVHLLLALGSRRGSRPRGPMNPPRLLLLKTLMWPTSGGHSKLAGGSRVRWLHRSARVTRLVWAVRR
jgi:hypothetical protein